MTSAKFSAGSMVFALASAALLTVPLSAQDAFEEAASPSIQEVRLPASIRIIPSETSNVGAFEIVFVRMSGGNRELWSGDLLVAEYRGATVRLDVQDVDARCPATGGRYATWRDGIELQINPNRSTEDRRFRVGAKWSRASEDCSERGTFETGFKLQVELPANETTVLTGDGGLRVELTPRS